MGCLIVILAMFAPRIALFFVWVFTPYVTRAFHGMWWWPLLGIIFVPFTTMFYSFVYVPGSGIHGARWLWVALGLVLDIIWHSASASKKARQAAAAA